MLGEKDVARMNRYDCKAGVDKGWGMPPLGITEPFGGGNEGLWETPIFLEFMSLLIRQTSCQFRPAKLLRSLTAYGRKRQEAAVVVCVSSAHAHSEHELISWHTPIFM